MKILIIEDDLALSDVISFTLRRGGFEVITAHDGQSGLASWQSNRPDLIVLDLNLPKLDGLEVCRRIRSIEKTPIIILSVRSGDEVVVKGLELGADDYIVKPFSPSQLVARVRAVLRRAQPIEMPVSEKLRAGGLELDADGHSARLDGRTLDLTPMEFDLLLILMRSPGRAFSRLELLERSQGLAYDGYERTIDVQVTRLRRKIEADTRNPRHLLTIRGKGYMLHADKKD